MTSTDFENINVVPLPHPEIQAMKFPKYRLEFKTTITKP